MADPLTGGTKGKRLTTCHHISVARKCKSTEICGKWQFSMAVTVSVTGKFTNECKDSSDGG
jgi:hypothetical protein